MCGIVGYIGDRKAAPLILDGLKRLEYRGYDSCGIATLDDRIHIKKDQGKIDEIDKNLDLKDMPGNIGVGHTRWATHGMPSKKNAHPHLDCKKEIAIVHNGIISNYFELKDDLIKKGHTFSSETDTEVIVHL
ncbi:MAG: glutamine--fructose-6-phosphate aminotransferase, partial [Candidatus Hydrothermarchaeales archaeon]